MSEFLVLALGTLASEDLTCITAGVLIAQGKLGFLEGTLGCLAGIVLGDVLLFAAGRWIGRAALRRPITARFFSAAKVDEASRWLAARGLKMVLISRFTPGLRLPTYFAAGSLKTRFWAFAGYFVLASAVWTPLLVGSTVLFGDELLRSLFGGNAHGPAAFATVSAGFAGTFAQRRRLIGFLKRIFRWEFWPPWLAYLPLLPYFVFLAARHRSLTTFTAANPGIPSGGLVGESKSEILEALQDSGRVAEFRLLPSGSGPAGAAEVMAQMDFCFPVVLKPDVGERGSGVAVVRSQEEMAAYLRDSEAPVILQEYIAGGEFGIFYYRYPGQARGTVFSVTEKLFPEVVGDGRSTLAELILDDDRAVCIARAYAESVKRPLSDVPKAGERVRLVELGSHCRGAIFLDGRRLLTPALEQAIDRVSQTHPGFFFGRFDVRTPSVEALREGIFTVIELNGVSAEATHIYDPAVSLIDAYRTLFQQWRMAFEVGEANKKRGARPTPLRELFQAIVQRFSASPRKPANVSVQAIADRGA